MDKLRATTTEGFYLLNNSENDIELKKKKLGPKRELHMCVVVPKELVQYEEFIKKL